MAPVNGAPVPMRRVMAVARGGRGEIPAHQRPAAVVPHDLPVAHPVALADRSCGKMLRRAVHGCVPMPPRSTR
jgi:hypothetical protein